jgi:hypothetical protein
VDSNQDRLPYIWEAPPAKKPNRVQEVQEVDSSSWDDELMDLRDLKRFVKGRPADCLIRRLLEREKDFVARRDICAKFEVYILLLELLRKDEKK